MSTVVKDLGAVSAYAYAVEKGYTGTEAEFAELMADYAEVGQRAEDAAESALNSKTAAQTAATTATTKASEAATSAQTATTKAGEAQTSAQTASGKASEASQSASQASGYAQTAETAKTDAQTAKTQAETARDNAVTAKTAAETAQGKAEDAQAAAESVAESIPSDYSQLSEDVSDLKSEITALESDGVAPSAEQLLSKHTTADAVPYLFRKTGGDGADREYVDAIVGGTVAWNQLCPISGNAGKTITKDGIGFTYNADGSITLNGTSTARGQDNRMSVSADIGTLIPNHVYFIRNSPVGGSANTFYGGVAGIVVDTGNGGLYKHTHAWNTTQLRFDYYSGVTFNNVKFYSQYIDLTQALTPTIADYIYSLEQATAGAGVAFFKSLFPNDYYPYNAGELKSVEGVSAHEMVGFNQWDEEWEVGQYNPTTAAPQAGTNAIRSKNYIPVLPNTSYNFRFRVSGRLFFYDAYKNLISTDGGMNGYINVRTMGANVHFVKFHTATGYGNTYTNDICINISDPTRNGQYEPYVKRSYPLDNSLTLRGISKLSGGKMYFDGDRYLPDGKVERRYGIVDLGTLNWTYMTDYSRFQATISDIVSNVSVRTVSMICSKYVAITDGRVIANVGDKCIYGAGNNKYIYVHDSDYTDATAFKTAMSGVILVYELATPTTEEATPYLHLQQCDPNGTEEFVSTGIIPVGHETRYPENLRAKIEGLPWDFSSLIAPTEKTTTASRNYTIGSLLIMGNTLYKVTANIANGGTIIPNTNVTATTLSEILSALAQ